MILDSIVAIRANISGDLNMEVSIGPYVYTEAKMQIAGNRVRVDGR